MTVTPAPETLATDGDRWERRLFSDPEALLATLLRRDTVPGGGISALRNFLLPAAAGGAELGRPMPALRALQAVSSRPGRLRLRDLLTMQRIPFPSLLLHQ